MPAQIKKLSRQDLLDASKEAKQKYVLIENKVYDVTDFVDEHPGKFFVRVIRTMLMI
jgi:cytochrome b involved in lipid metabolism